MTTTRRRHTPEQIVRKLSTADRVLAEGGDVAAACRELGVVGLVLAVVVAPLGLILSIVALLKSSKSGGKNVPALAGIVVSIVFIIIGAVLATIGVSLIVDAVTSCDRLGMQPFRTADGAAILCD